MPAGAPRKLLLIPTLAAVPTPGGGVVLTEKFVEGCLAFQNCWDGPMSVVFRPVPAASDNLDNREYRPGELPFEVDVVPFSNPKLKQHLAQATVALGGLSHQQTHLADWSREVGTPFAYTSEYTLETRLQIAQVEELNPLRRMRRMWFERSLEKRHLLSIRKASGLQCNGTPTYDAYKDFAPEPLLFFDTRLDAAHLISTSALDQRLAERERKRKAGEPIRLVFSGRLKEMKGVDHLLPVAAELKRLGVPFQLDIFGDGVLTPKIDSGIASLGLAAQVRRHGTLDFHSQLMPRIQAECDLFVACHRQGDPSCTYLETFGCGVPIAGYANEAFSGLLEWTPAGIKVPMDQPEALARAIQGLAQDTPRLAELSHSARSFASQNTCELTFQLRTEHLRKLARQAVSG